MKKILTLIAVAMMAISASAKQAIDFTKIEGFAYGTAFELGSWDWKGVTLAEGELIQDEEAKTADDSDVTYFDASAFDYVVVKYSAATVDVSLIVQYKCKGTIGQYGAEYEQGQATIDASATGGYAALALDADQKKTVNQVAIQSGNNAGSITIDEIYFATAAEWEAVKPAPAQTKDLTSSISGATSTNDDGTKVFTNDKKWGWFNAWLTSFDASAFDYLVVELAEPSAITVQAVIEHANGAEKVSAQIPAGGLFVKIALSEEGKSAISQVALQNVDPGTFVVKAVYFATEDYVNNMEEPMPDTLPLSLDGLYAGWNSEYDADSKTINITGSEDGQGGGRGWWLKNGDDFADYSHYDNAVIEFDPATTTGGTAIVKYSDGTTSEVEFLANATCVVVVLDAEKKSAVQQIYVMGAKGASYTLKAAYVAVASATPEANPGHPDPTLNLPLDNVNGGWGEGTAYDAETQTITIGEDWSGKGWWYGSDAEATDKSYYDNLVIEFDPATEFAGNVIVQYNEDGANSAITFYPGATTVVVALDPTFKEAIKQVYIQGPEGATYTLKAAYWAVEDATPEANLGTEPAPENDGDVDGNSVVDAADIVAVANVIAGNAENAKADVNGDGVVNIADIIVLANKIAAAE